MRLEALELHRVRLTLAIPFRSSLGATDARDLVLVRALAADSDGWGECAAMAGPFYTPEYVDGAVEVIRRFLVPLLAVGGVSSAAQVGPALASVKGHQMAKAAVETAILDAELRAAHLSMGAYLGAVHERVPAGVSIGIVDELAELLDTVGSYLAQGYVRIKLKIQPGWDVTPVRAVRQRFGDDVALQVDANGAYTLADARHLAGLDPFDLLLLEQPLADDDLHGHAELARLIRTPICLDESITSARTAADAIALGACAVVNIKPGRVGGYLEARRVHDICAASGVPVWCGGMFETGVGRAGNLALAGLPGFLLPGDLSASDRYYARDLTEPFVLVDGHIKVPTGAGIGVTPDEEFLAEVRSERELIKVGH